MAAGLGFKTFNSGDVLTAADTNGYLMQGVNVFADAAARTAAITSPQEGQMSFLKDTNSTEYYDGSSWVAVGAAGGGMTLISTTTLSGAPTTLSSIPQTYNSLFLVITGVTGNTSDDTINILPNNVNNLTDYVRIRSTAAFTVNNTKMSITGNVATEYTNANNAFAVTIYNYTSTTGFKPFQTNSFFVITTPTQVPLFGAGAFRSNTAITSLVFDYGGTNTFAGGTVLLYGVK